MNTEAFSRAKTVGIVNPVGIQFSDDFSPDFLDRCLLHGYSVVGCTTNTPWDETLETIENVQRLKRIVERHPKAYLLQSSVQLQNPSKGMIGVMLGFQSPKPCSDSMNLLEAFVDMGIRCSALALRENSYYGCGFASSNDSGLSAMGQQAVRLMNRRGVVVDLSHVGDRTAMDAVALSEHPVIFSHSLAREVMANEPKKGEWAGLENGAARRAAPPKLIVAAAARGGVFCPDVRLAESVYNVLKHIDYAVKLVGVDHVGVCAQEDWHRTARDLRSMQRYKPGYGSALGEDSRAFPTDYRISRLEDKLGPEALASDYLGIALRSKYSEADTAKIMGGNLIRVLKTVLQ